MGAARARRHVCRRRIFQEERLRGVVTPAENKSRGAHELALLASHGIAPPYRERLRRAAQSLSRPLYTCGSGGQVFRRGREVSRGSAKSPSESERTALKTAALHANLNGRASRRRRRGCGR